MMAVRFSGLSAIAARVIVTWSAMAAFAAEAPMVPELGESLLIPPEAEAPYQVVQEGSQRVRWLDPAIFTEITPVTVPDVAVKLPADQQE